RSRNRVCKGGSGSNHQSDCDNNFSCSSDSSHSFTAEPTPTPFPFLVICTILPTTVGPYFTLPALVTSYQKACMSQAAVGQRSAQRPQWRHTSSSLTITRPVLRPSPT